MALPFGHTNVQSVRRDFAPQQPTFRRPGSAAAGRITQIVLLLCCGIVSAAPGQEVINREYTIKAAYLYNLGRYITWPKEVFTGPQSSFVIGVLEPDFVGPDLEKVAEVKTIDNRTIQVQRFPRPEDVKPCHILFLPKGLDPQAQRQLIRRLAGTHTLLVGETDEFLDHGGAIAFVLRGNNVRLMIALEATQREKLQVSSKLLQIAQSKP